MQVAGSSARGEIRVVGSGSILVMAGVIDAGVVAGFLEETNALDRTPRGAAHRLRRVDWIDLGEAQELSTAAVEVLSALITQQIPVRLVVAHAAEAIVTVLDEHGVSALVRLVA